SRIKLPGSGLRINGKQRLYGINIQENRFIKRLYGSPVKQTIFVTNCENTVITMYLEKRQGWCLTRICLELPWSGFWIFSLVSGTWLVMVRCCLVRWIQRVSIE